MNTTGIVVAGGLVALVVILFYFSTYNSFVRLRNLVTESWKQVDVELQRRHDLVPNLVATVEQASSIERGTLEAVIEARNRAHLRTATSPRGSAEADEVGAVAAVESTLTSALGRLHALAEQHPEVNAVRNYADLQRELSDTEDRIAAARRLYNANVRALNTKIQSMPAAVVASLHCVSPAHYFELDGARARKVVDVDQLWRVR